MKSAGLRDEDVAVRVGVSAQTVSLWRRNIKTPRGPKWQLLRDLIPGFADHIDAQRKVASGA